MLCSNGVMHDFPVSITGSHMSDCAFMSLARVQIQQDSARSAGSDKEQSISFSPASSKYDGNTHQ